MGMFGERALGPLAGSLPAPTNEPNVNLSRPVPQNVLAAGLVVTLNSSAKLTAGPASGPVMSASARRRFRAADVALHLDMAVIGDVCIGVSLAGYRSVLAGFLSDESSSQAALLAALDAGQFSALPGLAHAVKGAAASMGLRTIRLQAQQIEVGGAAFDRSDCLRAATALREHQNTTRALLQRMGFL